jgi:preprotein translocase subunit YajC
MDIAQFLPLIILLVIFVGMSWYFGVRPMRQREKEHDRMVLDLQRGDRVITAGGIYGKVDSIYEDSIILEVESGAKIRVTKGGVVKKEGE